MSLTTCPSSNTPADGLRTAVITLRHAALICLIEGKLGNEPYTLAGFYHLISFKSASLEFKNNALKQQGVQFEQKDERL